MYKHTKMRKKNRDKLLDRKKGNRPKSLQSAEMDCQKDRNTSSTEIYLLLEDMFQTDKLCYMVTVFVKLCLLTLDVLVA